MFRRVELIHEYVLVHQDGSKKGTHAFKHGLCGVSTPEVIDAWFDKIRGPSCAIPANCRFYFTEKGWQAAGHDVIAACQRSGQKYRVLKIKESDLDIVYRDAYEVAGQPKRAGLPEGRKRRPAGWRRNLDLHD
jgi:hypothetical protein